MPPIRPKKKPHPKVRIVGHGRAMARPQIAARIRQSTLDRVDAAIEGPRYLAIDWIASKWAWVDPLKEVTADLLEVRAGFKPRSEAAGERGWSLEQLDAEIRNANDSADRHGLLLDSDPRYMAKNGALHKALEDLATTEEED
jgi:capsid protein